MKEEVKYRPFNEARAFVQDLGRIGRIMNHRQWREYCKSGDKPTDIPATPETVYKSRWKSVSDWLGSKRRRQDFVPFEEARAYAQSLRLTTVKEWHNQIPFKPSNIPSRPDTVYRKQWKSWTHWFKCSNAKKR